ncbi:MAG: hypothetical protein Q7U28_13870 [Aquabacterium sp.]|nr:hypothetical protein [Aquabacterium sp.]
MHSIKPLPEFTRWLDALPDPIVRGVVVARIKRSQASDIKRAKALAQLLD